MDATDDFGQKPIHLAAQSNKAEVVKVLLKLRPNSVSVATKVNVIYHLRLMKMLFEDIIYQLIDQLLSVLSHFNNRMEIPAPTLQHLKAPYL